MNAPARDSAFVGQLCIALAHRWEPERHFMILTAYFDESGTHDARVTVMAGFIAEARQWRKFEKRSAKLFNRFGVDVFHMTDLKRTKKAFSGWKVDKKIEFFDEFHHIINETLERGVASIISEDDYRFYCELDWPRRARWDSKYGILFRASIGSVLRHATDIPEWTARGSEPKLNIVLESGHPNGPDAVRIYDKIRRRFGERSMKALAGLTFASKDNCLPLAAADLFAYSAYGHEVGTKPLGVAKRPLKADASYPRNMYRVVVERPELIAMHGQALAEITDDSSASRRAFDGRRS
jgi:hypothetical protein